MIFLIGEGFILIEDFTVILDFIIILKNKQNFISLVLWYIIQYIACHRLIYNFFPSDRDFFFYVFTFLFIPHTISSHFC